MPFKSVRYFLSISLSLAAIAYAAIPSAHALTITPVNMSTGYQLSNVAPGNTAYYTAQPFGTSGAFIDSSDPGVPATIDVSKTQDTDYSGNPNVVVFNVASTVAVPVTPGTGTAQQAVIAVYAAGPAGTKVVPIAYVNPGITGSVTACDTTRCLGAQTNNVVNGITFFEAMNYTAQTTVQIGLYPGDICRFYYITNARQAATGCNGPNADTTGTLPPITLTFTVTTVGSTDASNAASAPPASYVTGKDDLQFSVGFRSTAPNLICPTDMSNLYFPGDGKITLQNTAAFGISNGISTANPGLPPASTLIVVWRDGATPDVSAAFATSGINSAPPARVTMGAPTADVSPFTNTTDGTDYKYDVSFMVGDFSGAVAAPANAAACGVAGVQTSQIQGFLKKSSCFIATAAFRSTDAEPVMLLRQFRDEILLHSDSGRSFVHWYYHWSPRAAEWLMLHPVFRFPVLLALVPLEILAWLWLQPVWLAALVIVNLLTWGFVRLKGGSV
jgi:hypothetical protein